MPAPRQLRFSAAFVLLLAAAGAIIFYATWIGYGGRTLTCAIIALAIFFAMELFPAAQNITQKIQRILPTPAAWLLAVPLFVAYAIYAAGTGSSSAWHWAIVAGYILFPLALLSLRAGDAPAWSDYLALIAIALPVKLRWLAQLWPYPNGNLKYALTVLLAMNVAIAGFIFIRRLEGIGYSLNWSANQGFIILAVIAIIAAVDIPGGMALKFLHWAPGHVPLKSLPAGIFGIFFFTAWPEEFVFRGLLQNMLSRTIKNENAGLVAASIIFGLSHIANGYFPNWRYALLATFAGLCYGFTWRKTGNIFAPALVHTTVDVIWHMLFV
ncbi:MAG TPA: CPBP family intramembrane glutamic endopeptidase [Candidatus Acidoferrales bacterium]